jgi:hypothetical protein
MAMFETPAWPGFPRQRSDASEPWTDVHLGSSTRARLTVDPMDRIAAAFERIAAAIEKMAEKQ